MKKNIYFHSLSLFIFLLLVLFLSGCGGSSDDRENESGTPKKTWEKFFGGSGYRAVDWARASSIKQTSDGGYIVAGTTNSFGVEHWNTYIIKIDKDGNKVWEKLYGGTDMVSASSIEQTSDGGYIVAGENWIFGEGGGVYVIKLDSDGNKVWEKTYGDVEGLYDKEGASSIEQTSDGGYIVAGTTDDAWGDVYVIKLDSNGNKVWDKTYGESYERGAASSIQQTLDGGYIVAGEIRYESYGDIYIIKLDSDGNKVWDKIFGGKLYDCASSIQQTPDGGYVAAGYTDHPEQPFPDWILSDIYVIKLDSDGNKVWDKTYHKSYYDGASSIQQTSDGGYIIAGATSDDNPNPSLCLDDFYIIKLDSDGNKVWDKTYGKANTEDTASSIQQTSDGGYIVAGTSAFFDGIGNSSVSNKNHEKSVFYIIKID